MSQNEDMDYKNLEELYLYGTTWLDGMASELQAENEEMARLRASLTAKNSQLERIRELLAGGGE